MIELVFWKRLVSHMVQIVIGLFSDGKLPIEHSLVLRLSTSLIFLLLCRFNDQVGFLLGYSRFIRVEICRLTLEVDYCSGHGAVRVIRRELSVLGRSARLRH